MSKPTWEQSPAELARTFASHYGWTGRKGGWIYDTDGNPVAHGWDELITRIFDRGWAAPGRGINWRAAGERPRLGPVQRPRWPYRRTR
jgi:hypothetical protein